ncbi:MAG: Hsp20/alpha crystallin family protein [Gammaproteobacteria bacterium]|nr:Hsp20/alpha crystallin family protein [Gammaproteobacteria bacterium]
MAKSSDIEVSKGGQQLGHRISDGDLWEVMDRMMDRFMGGRGWPGMFRDFPVALERPFGKLPQVDVIDGDKEIKVRAALPGVERKDLQVDVTEDMVSIRGSTRQESKEERENYFRSELMRGEFARTIPLPATVDSEKARATFKDGMLELVLPKTETRQRRSIAIE